MRTGDNDNDDDDDNSKDKNKITEIMGINVMTAHN